MLSTHPKRRRSMPDEKIAQKLPRSADPPAWTTTGAKSMAARSEDKDEGAPALEDVRTATEASAAAERRAADEKAARAERRTEGGEPPDSPKRQGDKLSDAVRIAASEPEVKDEP